MKFGPPISIQATDTGFRLVCMIGQEGLQVHKRAVRFRIPERVTSTIPLRRL